MKPYVIIALFGKSGSGKNYILNKYYNIWENENKSLHKIINYTTRPPREWEQEGEDYYFTSLQNLMSIGLKEDFIAMYNINNWYYLTPISALNSSQINIGIFDPIAVQHLINDKECRFEVIPIYIHCNDKRRLLNCCNREQNPDCTEICRRFLEDQKDFQQIDDIIPFYYEYYNDNKHKRINKSTMNSIIHEAMNILDRNK